LPAFAATYFAALNSARLALTRLEAHIAERGQGDDLDAYVAATYPREGDGA
jgi:hypothetical protein